MVCFWLRQQLQAKARSVVCFAELANSEACNRNRQIGRVVKMRILILVLCLVAMATKCFSQCRKKPVILFWFSTQRPNELPNGLKCALKCGREVGATPL